MDLLRTRMIWNLYSNVFYDVSETITVVTAVNQTTKWQQPRLLSRLYLWVYPQKIITCEIVLFSKDFSQKEDNKMMAIGRLSWINDSFHE